MRGSLAQLLPAIDGATMTADAVFDSVSTDSRTAGAGALFVALRGDSFDAHEFLQQVADKGAVAVVAEELPDGFTLPALIVPDTLVALGRIANSWRKQFDIPVIGVTGSNGKTTVKEMIAAILAAAYGDDARLATRGNLNNEIGVPLTLFRLGAQHKAAVIELGMNHPGEIARLTAIAQPRIAMVNNAQREHQEFMHTVQAVAEENGAVLAGLPHDGVAVFPGDDTYTALWQGLAAGRRTLTFGLSTQCNVSTQVDADGGGFGRALMVRVREEGLEARQFPVRLAAAGLHNVRNALAAIACAVGAGVPDEAIERGINAFEPVSGRLQKKMAAGGACIIDDTYNANPDSVRAAIDVLALVPEPRFLVLGDMGEVGTQGREFHEEIAAYAASRGIANVLVLGELARHMTAAGARHFEHIELLLAVLDQQLGHDSSATVLVKGSRFMKMERVVQHLLGSDNNNNKDAH